MTTDKLTKLTSRTYADACASAHALDLLGERWALLVIRELLLGPRRFSDLRTALPGISANVLTQRLEGLESVGVLRKRLLPPPARVQAYELTAWGAAAEEVILALGRWGVRSPDHDPSLPLSSVALMMSFKAKFDRTRAKGKELSLRFVLGDDTFDVRIRRSTLSIARASDDAAEPDVRITGAPSAIATHLYGNVPLDKLAAPGVTITGDRRAFQSFASLWGAIGGASKGSKMR